MIDRLATDFVNTRRANRIDWERPVTIVEPVQVSGKTINVSAVGILLSTDKNASLQLGGPIALDIPHMEGDDSIVVHGQIVRLEKTHSDLRVAVNLA